MLNDFKLCYGILTPEARRNAAVLAFVILIGTVFELAGIGSVYVLIMLIDNPARIQNNPIVADLLQGRDIGANQFVVAGTIVVLGFVLIKNLFLFGLAYLRARFVNDNAADLSIFLLRRYLAQPYAEFISRNSAEYVRDLRISVRSTFATVITAMIELATEGLVVLAVTVLLFVAEPLAAGSAVLVLGITFAATYRYLGKRTVALGKERHELNQDILKSLNHTLGHFKEIRVLGREAHFVDDFGRRERGFSENYRYFTVLNALPRLLFDTVVPAAVALVVVVVILGGRNADLLPLLGLFAMAAIRLLPSFNRILIAVNNVKSGRAAVAQVHADLGRMEALEGSRTTLPSNPAVFPFDSGIRFENVRYGYRKGEARPAVKGVSLDIHKGQIVGLVGPSGAGKSTLADILLGLLEPDGGSVTVDGRSIFPDSSAWQRRIGFVPQHIFLTDDTLRRNIAIGLDDDEIDADRLARAIELARLGDVVGEQENGLDTVIGERGVRLSGGQRQRVGIARALYGNPDVLVLDEATASLDVETEREINDAIDRLAGDKTIVVIAHRLSTVRRCDRIFFLRDGRIAAEGNFAELFAGSEDFRRMVELSEVSVAASERDEARRSAATEAR